MKLPEEEADNELGKRLREKFQGFNAPVKDQVRVNVFAALGKSPNLLYWFYRAGALLLVVALLGGYLLYNRPFNGKTPIAVLKNTKNADSKSKDLAPISESGKSVTDQLDHRHLNEDAGQASTLENASKQTTIQGRPEEKVSIQKDKANGSKRFTNRASNPNSIVVFEKTNKDFTANKNSNSDPEIIDNPAITEAEQPVNPALVSPIDSIHFSTSSKPLTIPHLATNTIDEAAKKPRTAFGLKGIFSAFVLQTFQLVNLSQSASDRIQNFRFAPLLSSKSLSYKFTAGVERKHTQLLVSYAYFRNWNEYEIGTNQVMVTRTAAQQYNMVRIGEKHVEDDRSHLLGIGLRQRFDIPQHIMKNYSVNVGAEYTRLLPKGQNLIWGNLGFYKQVYQTGGIQLQIGPYLQYSFTERKVAGQTWKSRPYQFGVSLGVKMK
ncbi:hypothetical protein [Dyadobacter sp.]|uniref:hypothetical protein n=1 Tax=Dyadobacter sp. TaxID=1914288 RepID=UPI003F727B4C